MTNDARPRTDLRRRITAAEQHVVDEAYRLLDARRANVDRSLAAALRDHLTGTPQSASQRDALVSMLEAQAHTLRAVEDQLVFGRMDTPTGRWYLGRLGLRDVDGDTVLLDWRADAAAAFYEATTASPRGLLLRRRLRLEARRVVDAYDDIVAAGYDEVEDVLPAEADAALMAVVQRPRTGRLVDVVATVQAEQDAAIRDDLAGVLVVEGSPGTGKTVVALHRVAYLLHRHRDHLQRQGVLLVGPGSRFLDHVSQVLPALGEDSILAATVSDLYGLPAPTSDDEPAVARVKGSGDMVQVLEAAVRSQPRVPPAPIRIDVDGHTVWLRPDVVRTAQQRAWATDDPYNRAREAYCSVVLDDLVTQLDDREERTDQEEEQEGPGTRLRSLVASSSQVRREVNLCWMPRSPEQLLARLYADPDFLRGCAPGWTAERRALLHRPVSQPWTVSDVPLLDQLAELLGPLPATTTEAAAARAADAAQQAHLQYAADALRAVDLDGMLTPELLVERLQGPPGTESHLSRDDTFGHVVVDEAQDLSPMQWRMILRRCPARSLTVVGDPDQATAPAATPAWTHLDELTGGRHLRRRTLTINYRVPGKVMDAARGVLPGQRHAPEKVRSLRRGAAVRILRVEDDPSTLVTWALDAAARLTRTAPGIVALVVPPELSHTVPALEEAEGVDDVSVLTPPESKGLEFDHVVLVEPDLVASQNRHGGRMLYVCLTRATRTVTIVHHRPLPTQMLDRRLPPHSEEIHP